MTDRCKHWRGAMEGATQLGRIELSILYRDTPDPQQPAKVTRVQLLLCEACVEDFRHWLGLRSE